MFCAGAMKLFSDIFVKRGGTTFYVFHDLFGVKIRVSVIFSVLIKVSGDENKFIFGPKTGSKTYSVSPNTTIPKREEKNTSSYYKMYLIF